MVKKLVVFVVLNLLFFTLQYLLSHHLLEFTDLQKTYIVNAVLTFLIGVGVGFSHKAFPSYSGFVYLAFGLVKMILIYALLNPKDQLLNMSDKMAVLIPLGLNLIIEIWYVAKLLNVSDISTKKV